MDLSKLKEIIIQTIAIVDELLGNDLNPKQELFCQFYTRLSDTYGNGIRSYALAYGHDLENADKDDAEWDEEHKNIIVPSSYDRMYKSCAVMATQLLRNINIIACVTSLKAKYINDDLIFDSKLMDIVQEGDHKDALAAIKHRNELKQRITKHVDVTSADEPLQIAGPIYVRKDDGVREDSGTEQAA